MRPSGKNVWRNTLRNTRIHETERTLEEVHSSATQLYVQEQWETSAKHRWQTLKSLAHAELLIMYSGSPKDALETQARGRDVIQEKAIVYWELARSLVRTLTMGMKRCKWREYRSGGAWWRTGCGLRVYKVEKSRFLSEAVTFMIALRFGTYDHAGCVLVKYTQLSDCVAEVQITLCFQSRAPTEGTCWVGDR